MLLELPLQMGQEKYQNGEIRDFQVSATVVMLDTGRKFVPYDHSCGHYAKLWLTIR